MKSTFSSDENRRPFKHERERFCILTRRLSGGIWRLYEVVPHPLDGRRTGRSYATLPPYRRHDRPATTRATDEIIIAGVVHNFRRYYIIAPVTSSHLVLYCCVNGYVIVLIRNGWSF